MSIERVCAFLRENDSYLITSHTNIDGDGAGAELAFFFLLKAMGKNAVIVNDQPLPSSLGFLPASGRVKTLRSFPRFQSRVFAALDCSDLSRTGGVQSRRTGKTLVLNIDHHISNSFFGDVNWVSADACCCCEMVYALYKTLRVPIAAREAACLYTGILMDTGSFRFTNTTSRTHRIAAELLSKGLKASDIYNAAYASIPYRDMQVLLSVLSTMRRERGGKLVWFQLERKRSPAAAGSYDVSESVLNHGRSVKGVEVVLLFKENPGRRDVRVNFRSQGSVDVNTLASLFGGGGHRTAAGATVAGSLETVKMKVLRAVRSAV